MAPISTASSSSVIPPTFEGLIDVPAGSVAFVVTYLEMKERPPPTAPARLDVTLAHEPRIDLDDYRTLYRAVGANWLWWRRLTMDDSALATILHDPHRGVFVLRRNEEPIGLLELDFRDPHDVLIAFFGLVPGACGRGIGRWLMDRALALAWQRTSTRRIWVHTCTGDSPDALPFYLKAGFHPFARKIEIARDPRLRGLLPVDAAPHIPQL